jgi:hypothetical protein
MDPAGAEENPRTGFPLLLGRATPAHRLHSLDNNESLSKRK